MRPVLIAICLIALTGIAFGQKLSWKKYNNTQGAFSVEFPGEPKISESTNKSAEGFDVKVKAHIWQEGNNVCYVLYNEMQPGINIMNDSVYLNTVVNQILEKFQVEPSVNENIKFQTWPGKRFVVELADGVAEGKVMLRTNRGYFVVAFFPKSRDADRKKFLDSFQFLQYQKMASLPYTSPDHFFKINFPAKPVLSTETTEAGKLYAYYALDPQSGNNFSVAVDEYSPYAQFESDSIILANRVQGYTLGEDSVLSVKDVIADGRPAKDLLIDQGENHFKLRVRVFTHGRYSYTIFAFLPHNEIFSPQVNQFFDSFRFTARVPGNLLSDKSELMLRDIESTDTTILNAVMPAIEAYSFEEKHVPRIHQLLEQKFDDDVDTTYSRKLLLLQSLAEIKSPSSTSFIKQIFPSLKGNAELEFNAIDVLVKLNTKDANELIAELLPSHTEVRGNIWKYSEVFSYARLDSSYRTDYFFKVLPVITKHSYKTGLYSLAQELLRKKEIRAADLAPYRSEILNDFKTQYETFKRDTIYQYLDDLTAIIAYDKVAKPEMEILKFLAGQENDYLAIRANTSLLRLQQNPNDKRVLSLAKDPYFRKDLLSELKDFDLVRHFPKQYYRQDSIAVSEIYAYVSDEYTAPEDLKVVHSEVMEYEGRSMRFFVLQFIDPEEGNSYRAVAGPYPIDKIEPFGIISGTFFDEDRDMDHHEYLLDYLNRFD